MIVLVTAGLEQSTQLILPIFLFLHLQLRRHRSAIRTAWSNMDLGFHEMGSYPDGGSQIIIRGTQEKIKYESVYQERVQLYLSVGPLSRSIEQSISVINKLIRHHVRFEEQFKTNDLMDTDCRQSRIVAFKEHLLDAQDQYREFSKACDSISCGFALQISAVCHHSHTSTQQTD
jgi:hypothetical protein